MHTTLVALENLNTVTAMLNKHGHGLARQSERIPSLDGLRAISIFLVLIGHMVGTQNFLIPQSLNDWVDLGSLGVRVFFIISGFLITGLLLRELSLTGSVNLSKFYYRRTLRIFPPYYLFVFVLLILQHVNWIQLAPADPFHTLTYTSNYYPQRSWYTGHTWSLSVEEQFYLLWPTVLLLAGRQRGKWITGSLIIICPFLRLLVWSLYPGYEVGHTFETVADSLAIGCLLAGTRERLHSWLLYRQVQQARWFFLIPLIVLATSAMFNRPRIYFFFGFTIMNVGIALCIDWCVTNYLGRIGRVLNSSALTFVGIISYSIYLWQQLFLNRYSQSPLCAFPLNILLVALTAVASYYLIEKPSLTLRQRFELKIFTSKPKREIDAVPMA